MKRAVLLLSSGLDSAANLALRSDFKVEIALTVHYGQRGAMRELERAARLAKHFGIEHVTFDLSAFPSLVGAQSALLGDSEIPSPSSLDDLSVTRKSATAVWVPNRNGVMLSIAAALAEARGLGAVAVGFNAEEAVTFPDNTPEFMAAITKSLTFSTANKVEIVSATSMLNKKQIVERLAATEFPFELLWSCYEAGERHCGRCESCLRLRRALSAALPESQCSKVMRTLFSTASENALC